MVNPCEEELQWMITSRFAAYNAVASVPGLAKVEVAEDLDLVACPATADSTACRWSFDVESAMRSMTIPNKYANTVTAMAISASQPLSALSCSGAIPKTATNMAPKENNPDRPMTSSSMNKAVVASIASLLCLT